MEKKRIRPNKFLKRLRIGGGKHWKPGKDRLAKYTVIQTWSAVISSALIAFIAFLQYQVTSRQVNLEIAKSSPTWRVVLKYDKTHHINGSAGKEFQVVPTGGNYSSLVVRSVESLNFEAIKTGDPTKQTIWCSYASWNYFLETSKLDLIFPRQVQIEDSKFLRDAFKKSGYKLKITPSGTTVFLTYDDAFGHSKSVYFSGIHEGDMWLSGNESYFDYTRRYGLPAFFYIDSKFLDFGEYGYLFHFVSNGTYKKDCKTIGSIIAGIDPKTIDSARIPTYMPPGYGRLAKNRS